MPDRHPDYFDAYHKKTVELYLGGETLQFDVSQTLFSSRQVDTGTIHLLKSLQESPILHRADVADLRILDLGCGYGPLGLTLARLAQADRVHLVDRDALALIFARHNAERNQIAGVTVEGSLGYDDVGDRGYDLIVSNIPGKAGESVIRAMLLDARHYLREHGHVAVVVVEPLEGFVKATLSTPDIDIIEHQTTSAHAIFHYRFTSPAQEGSLKSGLEQGIYDREELAFAVDELTIPMRTAHGLPEFDTLSYATELLLKALQDLDGIHPRHTTVFNPGQGHIPVVVARLLDPGGLDLIDRDLLSLRYSRLNLIDNGYAEEAIRTLHQVGLAPRDRETDLIVGLLREDEGPDAIERTLTQAALQLAPDGLMLIAGGSTPITRVLKSKEVGRYLRAQRRKRNKGNSFALLLRR
ncbi:MAG: methyltransferase [Anaerolineae bacterium]